MALLLAVVGEVEGTYVAIGDAPVAVEGRSILHDSFLAFDWSGVSFRLLVTNTSQVAVTLADVNAFYNVFVDGEQEPSHVIHANLYSPVSYSLLPPGHALLPSRPYAFLVSKRTEAQNNWEGAAQLYGITIDDGGLLEDIPWEAPKRRLEFMGDSVTCGYGILGNTTDCNPVNPEGAFEDVWLTYAQLLARNFDAAMHMEAWSGIGLVRNYGDTNQTSEHPFPSIWNRTIGVMAEPVYDFSLFVPDAVVVHIGGNDYSTGPPNPTQEQFETAYVSLIHTIRRAYAVPDLTFFLMCGPMYGDPCGYIMNVVDFVPNAHFINVTNILGPGTYGCDSHPNVAGHRKIAALAQPVIAEVMGW